MLFSKYTPPWLKRDVNFIHGHNKSRTIPFLAEELPRQDVFRRVGKKLLLCAIISTWIKKEPESSGYFRDLLESKGISLPSFTIAEDGQ